MQRMLSFAGPLASVTRSHLDSGLYSPMMSDSLNSRATRLSRTTFSETGTSRDGLQLDTAEAAKTAR